jgi:lipid-A-disaccharide synthase-like uncharacterized protein
MSEIEVLGFSLSPFEVLGGVGQALFFGRVVVQWGASERAGRSASPALFWWLSLVASGIMAVVAVGLEAWVLLPGYLVNGAIYGRNLRFGGNQDTGLGPLPTALLALTAGVLLLAWGHVMSPPATQVALPWLIVGLIGQTIWSTRFLFQWWLSERAGRSHFPMGFWWLSLVGSLFNLGYTMQLETPIFWIGFIFAWFVPLRNLMLESSHRRRAGGKL